MGGGDEVKGASPSLVLVIIAKHSFQAERRALEDEIVALKTLLAEKNTSANPGPQSSPSFHPNMLATPDSSQGSELEALVANVSDRVEDFAGAVRDIRTLASPSASSPLMTHFDALLRDFHDFQQSMVGWKVPSATPGPVAGPSALPTPSPSPHDLPSAGPFAVNPPPTSCCLERRDFAVRNLAEFAASRVEAEWPSSSSSSSESDVSSSCAEDDSVRSWFARPPARSGPRGMIVSESASASPGEGAVYRRALGSEESPTGAGQVVDVGALRRLQLRIPPRG